MTLVDTNILLDLVTADTTWRSWSLSALTAASQQGPLLISAVVYAELAVRYDQVADLDAFVDGVGVVLADMPRPALFLAAKAFRQYRSAGGTRTGVLPDFFIGAHAAALGVPLMTRDVARYRTYFPGVTLISPTLS